MAVIKVNYEALMLAAQDLRASRDALQGHMADYQRTTDTMLAQMDGAQAQTFNEPRRVTIDTFNAYISYLDGVQRQVERVVETTRQTDLAEAQRWQV